MTHPPQRGLHFERLLPALVSQPPPPALQTYGARDGAQLAYRHYPSGADVDLVLLHGSGAHSAYLQPFAEALRAAAAADVYTPDLRGHGPSPQRRGDIDYVGQLEDDLADLLAHIAAAAGARRRVVVAGHSSGGGLAIRFAGGRYGDRADAYLLLAPYLGHDAPTVRPDSGGWALPSRTRIVVLALLNRLGVTRFDGTRVLRFAMPEPFRTGAETLHYSYRLMTGFNPTDYRSELRALRAPLLVLIGSEDEAFLPERFAPTIEPLVPGASVRTITGASHLDLAVDPRTSEAAIRWLNAL